MPIYLVNSENKHIKSHCSTTESATYLLDPFRPYQSTVTFRGKKIKQQTTFCFKWTMKLDSFSWELSILFRNRCVTLQFSPEIALPDGHLSTTVISQNAKGQTTFTSHQLTLSKQFLNFQEQWTIIVHLWGDTWSCYTQWVKTMSKVLWKQHNSENVFIPHTQKNAVPFFGSCF